VGAGIAAECLMASRCVLHQGEYLALANWVSIPPTVRMPRREAGAALDELVASAESITCPVLPSFRTF